MTAEVRCVTIRTEVSREGQGGVWARQRGRRGGQDQTFPVACTTATMKKREIHVINMRGWRNCRVTSAEPCLCTESLCSLLCTNVCILWPHV